ncbi:MAG: hypothetical protein RL456_1807, partial [Pseudomonadota bacterium]
MMIRSAALLRRDTAAPLLVRAEGTLAIKDKEKRIVEVSLTSETPVKRYGDTEILSHEDGHVRLDRLRAVGAFHLDHDTTKRVAAIRSVELRDRKVYVTLQFGRTAIADEAWKDVEDGILKGTSAGYRIHRVEVNDDTRTYKAVDWEIFEGSFTSIPADPNVGVGRSADQESLWRSLTTNAGTPAQETTVNKLRAILALIDTHRHLEDELLARADKIAGDTLTEAQHDELKRYCEANPAKQDDAKLRAELTKANLDLEIIELARSHGVPLARTDLAEIKDRDAGTALVLKRAAEANRTAPGTPIPGVTITRDAQDKRNDAAVDGFLSAYFSERDMALLKDDKPKETGMR